MPYQLQFTQGMSGGGTSIQSPTVIRSGSGSIGVDETLAAGRACTLSTRASGTAGTLTIVTGHTIITGDKIDIHWTDGGANFSAYGATAGTVASAPSDTSIPFTLAAGDALPVATTAVVVSEQLVINHLIDGDNTRIIGVVVETLDTSLRTGVHVQFLDVTPTEVCALDLVTNVPRFFDIQGGSSNPFTGNVILSMRASNGGTSTTEVYTLKVAGVQDASP